MDKFSKLIAQGVAKFEYTPIASQIPTQCHICRGYNNVYSIANDTHMSELPDGRHVITGHAVKDKKNFDSFLYSCCWSGINFIDSGYESPCVYFNRNKLIGHYDVLNGDVVYILETIPDKDEQRKCLGISCPDGLCCAGTSIPEQLRAITTDGDESHIRECFKQPDVAKALNEDIHVRGVNWTVVGLSDGNHIVSVGRKKTYIL